PDVACNGVSRKHHLHLSDSVQTTASCSPAHVLTVNSVAPSISTPTILDSSASPPVESLSSPPQATSTPRIKANTPRKIIRFIFSPPLILDSRQSITQMV